jgi:antibiotic biosynthesis monooxygenase (ABM) superfamily enzyme
MNAAAPDAGGVTVVTQTRVRDDMAEAFARWQQTISAEAAASAGFVEQTIMPPHPPAQVDWVILQRFTTSDAAVGWLRSDRRLTLLAEAAPLLAGPDDVHLVRDAGSGVMPAPVSVVISTRIKPDREVEYRRWEQRIAAAQAQSAGFQGYRIEPPIPGVQDDWLAIIRFDTEEHLQAWLDSPERRKLLKEGEPFIEEVRARVVRSGFGQWFASGDRAGEAPAAWKQNMIVLLLLYPVVFLFGAWVQAPLLMGWARLPFWLALFIGNVVSVLSLNWLVPWTCRGFGWWLSPVRAARLTEVIGAGLVVALYAVWLCIFWRMS